jgi:hypothetical protein
MTGQEKITHGYTVSVRPPADAADGYHVFYTLRGLQEARTNGGAPRQAPTTVEAVAHVQGEDVVVRWVNAPSDPQASQEEFEQDVRGRVRTLDSWLGRLESLVRDVEGWAKELGWATRWIEKRLDDSQIGKYSVPALILQDGTDRILLEPIGRSAPGAEGVVDLYRMPAYDDIATLYYYDGRWNLHYFFPGTGTATGIREAPAKPLSKETLQEVLAEMKQHAA